MITGHFSEQAILAHFRVKQVNSVQSCETCRKTTLHISIWNEYINLLKNNVPIKKHRVGLRYYENTFSGAEAVQTILTQVKIRPDLFSENTNRRNLSRLCNKLLERGVLEKADNDRAGTRSQSNNDKFLDSKDAIYRISKAYENNQTVGTNFGGSLGGQSSGSGSLGVGSLGSGSLGAAGLGQNLSVSEKVKAFGNAINAANMGQIEKDMIQCVGNVTFFRSKSETFFLKTTPFYSLFPTHTRTRIRTGAPPPTPRHKFYRQHRDLANRQRQPKRKQRKQLLEHSPSNKFEIRK